MLISFFQAVRAAGVPASVTEFLALLQGLRAGVAEPTVDDFYTLARMTLVKDERHFDKFDRAFAAYIGQTGAAAQTLFKGLPPDWLRSVGQRVFSAEELAALKAMGWEELMQTLAQRLAEQTERHAGGSRWIGTGGTSPFGHGGANPRGVRIGGPGGRRSAVKVWEQRLYRDYDGERTLGTRNLQMALRRLRRFAREGAQEELDLPATIARTAANAGLLDVQMRAERRNRVKVLLLMDVGGTMDDHVHQVEELFSAVKAQFKHLHFFYFHNCVYDHVWRHNARRHSQRMPTWDVIHTYNKDHKLIFVGDATMSPYEILQPGGSVEYHNPEAGALWMERLTKAFPKHAWINPEPQGSWGYRRSTEILQALVQGHMYPMTLAGLDDAMQRLSA